MSCGRSFAIISRGSIGRSCSSTRSPRSIPAPTAVRDLETALTDVLTAFRTGRSNLLSTIFRPKIDRILFAATKADHLHHTSHDRLEAILRHLTARAITRAEGVGAKIDVIALAAVRATREAMVRHEGETLSAIVGTPVAGERIGDEVFDGVSEGAIFPGELPDDPRDVFRGETLAVSDEEAEFRFLKFRPPDRRARPRSRRRCRCRTSGSIGRWSFCSATD